MNQWNVELYRKHSYVWQYGSKLLEMLDPQPGEHILDLGCGTGELTAEIAATGARVVGLDAAPSAIAQCHQQYPQIEFVVANGADFSLEAFDAVFSNAALHWIHPPAAAVKCIDRALKPGGRLVAEFGGKGNIAQIIKAITNVLPSLNKNRWYFPSIGEYSSLLEQQGFTVNSAGLFSRPTKLAGEDGLANWLEMFAHQDLKESSATKALAIAEIESELRPSLYRDGNWWADYYRIQVVATKPNSDAFAPRDRAIAS